MTIITILLAFFCDKLQGLQKIKHYHWVNAYAEMILQLLPATRTKAPWWGFIAILFPLCFLVFMFQLISQEIWFGIVGFIFSLFILCYCLGSSRIGDYLIAVFSKRAHKPVTVDAQESSSATVEERAVKFIEVTHQEIFAIIFWFILLGAVGAVTYRMLVILKQYAQVPSNKFSPYLNYIEFCLSVLNWPSIRLLSLCLSLGGAFTKAFPVWCQGFLGGLHQSQALLADCTTAAAELDDINDVEHLFYRSTVIFLVVLALMTLASVIS